MAVAHVRSDTLTGDPYTTERWPIAAGAGLGPAHLSVTDGGRALCTSERTASRADTATQRKGHHTYTVTQRGGADESRPFGKGGSHG